MKLLTILLVFVSSLAQAEVDFEEDHRLPLVFVNVGFRGGSSADTPETAGLTNFLGEILLRGTRSKSKKEIDQLIDLLGVQLYVETQSEATLFRAAVLSENLEKFLELFEEMLTEPGFGVGEISKLKKQTLSQILSRRSQDTKTVSYWFNKIFYEGHPYAIDKLGIEKTISPISKDVLQKKYTEVISRDHLFVVGTGDTNDSIIESWEKNLRQKLPPTKQLGAFPTFEPAEKRQIVIIDKPERTQSQVIIGQKGKLLTEKDYIPLYVANHAFGGSSLSSTLMQEIRVKRGWSYGAYSYFALGSIAKAWMIYLAPSTQQTGPAVEKVLSMLDDLKNKGLGEEEVARTKVKLMNSDGFRYNTPQKRNEIKLIETIYGLPKDFLFGYHDRIKGTSTKKINQALKSFITPDRSLILVLGTASKIKGPLAKAANVDPKEIRVIPYTLE